MYSAALGDLPLMGYGKGYASEPDWAVAVAQDWGERLTEPRGQWFGTGTALQLSKAGLQGRGLSRETIVRVLQQVLEPIGGVQGNLVAYPEIFGNKGVRAN